VGCCGGNGGRVGKPFCVTVDLSGKAKDLGGLVDGEPLAAGQVLRVVTTGGGGWGDPLEREPELVRRDVIDGKVSLAAARADYGVVLAAGNGEDEYEIDRGATEKLRADLRAARRGPLPIIDRGPGYERMSALRPPAKDPA